MNTRDGQIVPMDELLSKPKDQLKYFKEMKLPLTDQQIKNGKIGRDELCPCGSGKKFKKCCLNSV